MQDDELYSLVSTDTCILVERQIGRWGWLAGVFWK